MSSRSSTQFSRSNLSSVEIARSASPLGSSRSLLSAHYQRTGTASSASSPRFGVWTPRPTPRVGGTSPSATTLLAACRRPCSNDWVYTGDETFARLEDEAKIPTAAELAAAEAAAAEEARIRAQLASEAEPAVAAVEAELIASLISAACKQAWLDINSDKVKAHNEEARRKRDAQATAKKEEDAKAARRAELAKQRERDRKAKEAKLAAKMKG